MREAEEVKVAPRIDEKLFQIEARPPLPVPSSLLCSLPPVLRPHSRPLQVDLVRRENERLNRQIEILANKFKAKVSSDVLVREGWLEKRSDRLHHANVLVPAPVLVALRSHNAFRR